RVFGTTLFATIGLLFLLSAIHVFTATLYQSLFGKLPNTSLGAIAFVVFGLSLLAIATASRLGPRRGVAVTAALLAVPVVLITAVRQEWVDLVLSAIAVVAGTQWLAVVAPLLLVAETGGLDGAQAALSGGLGLDGGPSTQVGMLVVGIGIAAGAIALARGVPARPAAAAAIAVGATLLWLHIPVVSL